MIWELMLDVLVVLGFFTLVFVLAWIIWAIVKSFRGTW